MSKWCRGRERRGDGVWDEINSRSLAPCGGAFARTRLQLKASVPGWSRIILGGRGVLNFNLPSVVVREPWSITTLDAIHSAVFEAGVELGCAALRLAPRTRNRGT